MIEMRVRIDRSCTGCLYLLYREMEENGAEEEKSYDTQSCHSPSVPYQRSHAGLKSFRCYSVVQKNI